MDVVTKGEKAYAVKEWKNHWTVSTGKGKLTIDIRIAKDLCETFEDLKKYIENENIF